MVQWRTGSVLGYHYYCLQGWSDEGLDVCLVIPIILSKDGPMKDWICAWWSLLLSPRMVQWRTGSVLGDHYYCLQERSDEGLDLCLVITIILSKDGPMKDWICAFCADFTGVNEVERRHIWWNMFNLFTNTKYTRNEIRGLDWFL